MEQDEVGTLVVVKVREKKVLQPLVARHQGRVFNSTGDCVRIQFGTAVDALDGYVG